MGNTVTIIKDGVTETFENVLGHQIGNGAIQIIERNGNQRVVNNFDDVTIILDDEAAAKFEFDLLAMEKGAEDNAQAAEEADAEDAVATGEADAADVSH